MMIVDGTRKKGRQESRGGMEKERRNEKASVEGEEYKRRMRVAEKERVDDSGCNEKERQKKTRNEDG